VREDAIWTWSGARGRRLAGSPSIKRAKYSRFLDGLGRTSPERAQVAL